jgi:hypothetical protein
MAMSGRSRIPAGSGRSVGTAGSSFRAPCMARRKRQSKPFKPAFETRLRPTDQRNDGDLVLTLSQMRSRLVPWMVRIGRGCGGQCTLGPVLDRGTFEVIVTWHDKGPDGTRTAREYRRLVTESDLDTKPCALARGITRHLLDVRLRGADI